MTRRDDDRTAYLAGEGSDSLASAERTELDEVRLLLASAETWEQPADDLEDRIVEAIAEEMPVASAESRAPRRRSRPRRRRWRPIPVFAAAATAAAVAIVVVLSAGSSSPAPQQFAMVVSGTALAPSADGKATLTKTGSGWRIALSASGLPHLSGGRYYEAWLKSASGVLVPIGTFNDGRKVTLWAGVPPTQFPSLTVTRQRADGNATSSGERVLSGAISTNR